MGANAVYLPVHSRSKVLCWIRYEPATDKTERLDPDYLVCQSGMCRAYGFSSRFGLVGWGDQVCRLVAAPQRPADAICRRLALTPHGICAWFGTASSDPPSDAGNELAGVPVKRAQAPDPALPAELTPAPHGPILDDLIGELDPVTPHTHLALLRLAELNPLDVPAEKRQAVATALIPRLTAGGNVPSDSALKAFAVWHTADCVPALLPFLHSKDVWVRNTVLLALSMCKDPRVIPELAPLIDSSQNALVLNCLALIGPASEQAIIDSIHPHLCAAYLQKAVDALAIVGTRRSVPILQGLLDGRSDPETTELVHEALEMIRGRDT